MILFLHHTYLYMLYICVVHKIPHPHKNGWWIFNAQFDSGYKVNHWYSHDNFSSLAFNLPVLCNIFPPDIRCTEVRGNTITLPSTTSHLPNLQDVRYQELIYWKPPHTPSSTCAILVYYLRSIHPIGNLERQSNM